MSSKKYQQHHACNMYLLVTILVWFILAEIMKDYEHIIFPSDQTHMTGSSNPHDLLVGVNNVAETGANSSAMNGKQWLRSLKEASFKYGRKLSSRLGSSFILFAEAGKKKKKEKL